MSSVTQFVGGDTTVACLEALGYIILHNPDISEMLVLYATNTDKYKPERCIGEER